MVKILLGDVDFEINQSELTISKLISHRKFTLIDGSEGIDASKAKLDVFEFSGYIYNFDNYDKICKIIDSGTPQGLLISGLNIDISASVLVESFVTKESGGDIFCIEYFIKLIEYRDSEFKVVSNNSSNSLKNSQNTVITETNNVKMAYTVQSGDTLYAISKKYLGSGDRYMEIATANNIKNPNLIYPGQVIYI